MELKKVETAGLNGTVYKNMYLTFEPSSGFYCLCSACNQLRSSFWHFQQRVTVQNVTIFCRNYRKRLHTREPAPARSTVSWGGRRRERHRKHQGTEAAGLRHHQVAAAAAAA